MAKELKFDIYRPGEMAAGVYGYFIYEKRNTFKTPEPCGLCVKGETRFNRYGWGNNYIVVSCSGCGKSFTSRNNGETWEENKREVVTVTVENDPGGEEGEFEQYMRDCLAEWFDGAKVTNRRK